MFPWMFRRDSLIHHQVNIVPSTARLLDGRPVPPPAPPCPALPPPHPWRWRWRWCWRALASSVRRVGGRVGGSTTQFMHSSFFLHHIHHLVNIIWRSGDWCACSSSRKPIVNVIATICPRRGSRDTRAATSPARAPHRVTLDSLALDAKRGYDRRDDRMIV